MRKRISFVPRESMWKSPEKDLFHLSNWNEFQAKLKQEFNLVNTGILNIKILIII
jgi:hypothetical protein